jgi:sensor histidine kinase YesM
VVSFAITLNLFSTGDEIRRTDWIYTFLFHIPLVIGVVFNQFSLKYFLEKKLTLAYILSFFLSIIFVVQIYPITFDLLAQALFPSYYFVAIYSWYEILGIGLIYITLSLLLYLSKSWFEKKETEIRVTKLEEEKTKSELKALRAQINPHFLFNSLNMIYGEALRKTDKAPAMILKLSDILRYVVDNMNHNSVTLNQEIEYIEKFIDLQKERLSNPERVIFSKKGDFDGLNISPLLLITFIENAFKHGSVSGVNERIAVNIVANDKRITLLVQNATNNIEVIDASSSSGMGLVNTKRRLEFIYADKYSLEINQKEEFYKIELIIDLI